MRKVETENDILEEHEEMLKMFGFWKVLWCRYLVRFGFITKEELSRRQDEQ